MTQPDEDETLWYVPLQLKTVDKSGKTTIDPKAILETRDAVVPLNNSSDAVYKLNGETCGVCKSFSALEPD